MIAFLRQLVLKRLDLSLSCIDCRVNLVHIFFYLLEELIQIILLAFRHLVEHFLDLCVHILIVVKDGVSHEFFYYHLSLVHYNLHQLTILILPRQLHFCIINPYFCKPS